MYNVFATELRQSVEAGIGAETSGEVMSLDKHLIPVIKWKHS